MALSDNNYVHGLLTFAISLMFLMPIGITLFVSLDVEPDTTNNEYLEQLNKGYADLTGSAPVSESVWGLRGIYTPYTGGAYGYTADGWLYGTKIYEYSPSQYSAGPTAYTVTSREVADGQASELPVYEYSSVPQNRTDLAVGDMYTSVAFDVNKKSDIFFTSSGKTEIGDNYYYEYSGYRYSFAPLQDIYGMDNNGDAVPIVANTSSLSLIWYDYYGSSGISGQLIITGSDSGVSYVTANDIIQAFDGTTNTARFEMQFNGISCNLYVKMDSYYLAGGMSIADCYNAGYWSVMVTSLSTTVSSYTGTDYSFNIYNVFETLIDLLTFNLDDYGFSPMVSTIASAVVVVPLYVGLISIGLSCYPVLLLAGALAVFQGMSWLGGIF